MRLGVIRDGRYLSAEEADAMIMAARSTRSAYPTPQLSPDYAPYRSPLGNHRVIEGRRARREEMARANVRPLEKGEGLGGVYHNKDFCERNGLPWTPPPASKADPDFAPAPFVRSPVTSRKR